jgi:transposase InsO family protein
MRRLSLRSVMRGKVARTTIGDSKAPCRLGRLNRSSALIGRTSSGSRTSPTFRRGSAGSMWSSSLDIFAKRIVGWRGGSSMRTDFVLDALRQALYARQPERDRSLVVRYARGSQYVPVRYSERLAEAGVEPSVGSKGDSYDNALAETINGLYKAELIHRKAQWIKEPLELATLEWVS